MGLDIEVRDEWGALLDSAGDPKNFLGRLLPQNDDPLRPMLASIDFYGDTVFNRMQMSRFLAEWSEISIRAQSPEERELVGKIESFARRVQDEVHLYLKFIETDGEPRCLRHPLNRNTRPQNESKLRNELGQ